jgi:hypothetical protein
VRRDRAIPVWVDGAIRRAVHPDPAKRYEELFEFVFALCQPKRAYLDSGSRPLLERDPLLFWKGLCAVLTVVVLLLLLRMARY